MTTGLVIAVALEPDAFVVGGGRVTTEAVSVEALEQPAAAHPSSASFLTEIAPLGGSQERQEAPTVRSSGSRPTRATHGRVTTKTTSSPGFVRFQIRTAPESRRPRFGPRKLPMVWLVVRVVKSERINGQPRLKLVAYIGSIRRDDIDLPGARRRFWARAAEQLEQFTPEAREKFEQKIWEKIPCPPAEPAAVRLARTIEEARARSRAKLAAIRAENANQEIAP